MRILRDAIKSQQNKIYFIEKLKKEKKDFYQRERLFEIHRRNEVETVFTKASTFIVSLFYAKIMDEAVSQSINLPRNLQRGFLTETPWYESDEP